MITISLDDPYLRENLKAIADVKEFGFTDEEIQELYDRQIEFDKSAKGGADNA